MKVRIFKRSSNLAGRVGLTGGRCKTPQRLLLLTGLELSPYGGQVWTRDSSDLGVLLFVVDGRHLAEG